LPYFSDKLPSPLHFGCVKYCAYRQSGFRVLVRRHFQAIDAMIGISRLNARPFAALTPTLNPLKLPALRHHNGGQVFGCNAG